MMTETELEFGKVNVTNKPDVELISHKIIHTELEFYLFFSIYSNLKIIFFFDTLFLLISFVTLVIFTYLLTHPCDPSQIR